VFWGVAGLRKLLSECNGDLIFYFFCPAEGVAEKDAAHLLCKDFGDRGRLSPTKKLNKVLNAFHFPFLIL
jgi:hypothetical protein